jgi:hypothetical protein
MTGTILVVLGYLCSKLEPRPARLLLIFAVFAIELYGAHSMISVTFGPGRASNEYPSGSNTSAAYYPG